MRPAARALVAASAAVLVAATGLATAGSAAAATYDEATWYYDAFKMPTNLAVANGTGVSIALIDGSIDTSVPELSNATIETQPSQCVLNGSTNPVDTTTDATHGTQMAVMLAGNGTGTWDGRGGKGVAPGAKILYYRNSTDKTSGSGTECRGASGGADGLDAATAAAITDAVAKGARVVNMSFGSDGMTSTSAAILAAERRGVVLVGTTDDTDSPIDPSRTSEPGTFNGVVMVNGRTPVVTTLAPKSSLSDLVTVVAPGDTLGLGGINPATGQWDSTGISGGSSAAAAFTSGVIADAMSKWPNATGNQILQLLVRTTGGSLHDIPTRAADGFGFGAPSLTAMLATDPSGLPDTNPLLRDGAEPSTAEILGTASSSSAGPSGASSAASSPASTATPVAIAGDTGSSSWPLLLGIGIAVLVVLAVVVAVLVLRARRRPPGAGPPPGGGPVGATAAPPY